MFFSFKDLGVMGGVWGRSREVGISRSEVVVGVESEDEVFQGGESEEKIDKDVFQKILIFMGLRGEICKGD